MLIYETTNGQTHEEPIRFPAQQEVAWIRMENPSPGEVKHVLGNLFHCHPLLVEDAVKLNQRPKIDTYTNHVFLTFFAISEHYQPQEIGIVIGANYIITVYKEKLPFLDQLYQTCLEVEGKMSHPGVILHALLDRCVDDYSVVVDHFDDRLDAMEQGVYENPSIRIAQDIFQLKRTMHQLRRVIVEERIILSAISHHSFPYTRQEDEVYFIDIMDHISRVVDSLDIFRESLTGLLELQMSMKSDRMNEIMKTLTLFSTIFLPLTFIVGLYGMNFKYIPELTWDHGYLYAWILMIIVGGCMWYYFKRKRWF
ncbi:magnesium/cobalt transporter CorA [Paenibacillus sp. SYP-B3998]|uniref:Magnesium transport protein CorA n=1 Tax=Paenibacillus sp. SYP-B3998 TaxID=2678564 RepID=A0A6G3ZY96_9BACL|nr:magnesium/cobalt transporter CorA [Paenibacillus sp. SYP-B3998]NEW07112.1 magnesium/cobalt transporter CorA [Paenibacillus sp. SYP-B3998]